MSVADKLDRVLTRVEELKHLLATAEGGQFGTLSKELSELEPVAEKVRELRAAERARDEAEAMLADRSRSCGSWPRPSTSSSGPRAGA